MDNKKEIKDFIKNKIESSMKYQDLQNLSVNEITKNYENLLAQREKQIRDMTYELGMLNEKYFDLIEKKNKLSEDSINSLNENLKIEKKIKDETYNKNIMLDQISYFNNDNDQLRLQIKDMQLNPNNYNKTINQKSFENYNSGNNKKRGRSLNSKDNAKKKSNKKDNVKLLSEDIDYEPVFN